jgi:hypothetical protein
MLVIRTLDPYQNPRSLFWKGKYKLLPEKDNSKPEGYPLYAGAVVVR